MMRVFISILFLGLVSCDSSAGGIHDGIVDPQKSQDLAMFAVDTINSGSNAEYKSNLVQVNSVRTQMVVKEWNDLAELIDLSNSVNDLKNV